LYDTVKREKGSIDVLWASAGMGEPAVLGEITENSSTAPSGSNARGTLFTVQKALPLINDNGSIFMTGSNASLGAFPGWSLYAEAKPSSRPGPASGSTNCATANPGQRPDPRPGRHRQTGRTVRRGNQGRHSSPSSPAERWAAPKKWHRRPVPRLRRLQLRQRPGTVTDGGTTAI